MNAGIIAAIIVIVVVLVALTRMVRIVPQARGAVVERLGRYVRTATPGLTLLLPFVDRMRPLIDLREQVVSFPPQPVITSDNLTVAIDSVIYFQVTDPRAASYEIQNYIQAVETTFAAIHAAKPDPALLAYQYLQTLPQIAQGDANKVWVIPSEFSKALEGLAKLGGAEGADAPSWLQATGPPDAGRTAPELDASTWFDSNLPPAHEQREAVNIRASDNDPESLEAHAGLPPDDLPLLPPQP